MDAYKQRELKLFDFQSSEQYGDSSGIESMAQNKSTDISRFNRSIIFETKTCVGWEGESNRQAPYPFVTLYPFISFLFSSSIQSIILKDLVCSLLAF